ncbi:MAG: hypothetical protein HYS76_01650 [Candidatus Wildermuthbacteria bacterium]|nr:hypothetical protein [Candidatus Wildermuthbacteria bacterium]
MNELVLVGKTVALVCSLAGLYFTVKREHQKSSLAWNGAAAILWMIVSFAA